MPRLLLVDDNPSIHRIAESLLAPTDVELVCVDSAAEALDRIGRGERFDVALVDTAMPGMDGWTLLSRLRANEATATMPIALMAGVLDPVDPSKLAKAPVQGFLKKPIELRELGDRVKALLATPVAPPASPSPFSTVPATPAADLVQRANAALPEYRPEPIPEPMPAFPSAPEPEDDLLVLTSEDLWPEEAAPVPAAPEAPAIPEPLPEVHLELEELDLESLQDLGVAPAATAGGGADILPGAEPVFPDDALVTLSGLEELDLTPEVPMEAPAPAPAEPELAEPELAELELEPLDADLDLAPLEGLPAGMPPLEEVHPAGADVGPIVFEPERAAPVAALIAPHVHVPEASEAMAVPPHLEVAVGGQAPAAPGQAPAGTPGPAEAQAVVQAILGDPVLVDALVKAVVARMGDQAIREIAWEVIPDLAGRLHS